MVGPTPIKIGTDYTLGAMYAQEMLLFCGLFAMIISALHVVSHTRKEEELGLTELVRSFRVGRQANSLAVISEMLLINLLLGLLIGGLMMSFGVKTIDAEGAFLVRRINCIGGNYRWCIGTCDVADYGDFYWSNRLDIKSYRTFVYRARWNRCV